MTILLWILLGIVLVGLCTFFGCIVAADYTAVIDRAREGLEK